MAQDENQLNIQPFVLNVGPQHPSTHGVFRMLVTLDGETIVAVEPIMGYLHRSVEKLAEERTYTQNIPFTDRLDYLAAMSSNLAYVLAVEKVAQVEVPERASYLRVIFAELQRLASHALGVGTFINDIGAASTPLLYMFRERESILDLFEMTCGARLTVNYMRIGGVSQDIPTEFPPALTAFVSQMKRGIEEYHTLLEENEILIARAKGVGILPAALAINASASGPLLRGSGVKWDLRKADPYCVYDRFDFDIPTGVQGDCYDRFMVRLLEMSQSVRIIEQAAADLPSGPVLTPTPLAIRPPRGEGYGRVESPRGELGFYVVSDGTASPYRFKVRAPSFINLTTLADLAVGWKMADLIAITGSLDFVMGEVDR